MESVGKALDGALGTGAEDDSGGAPAPAAAPVDGPAPGARDAGDIYPPPTGGPPAPVPQDLDVCSFLKLHAPNGQTWAEYVGAVPPACTADGKLTGAWSEIMYASVIFEQTHPGWNELPEYQDNGPAGYVEEYLHACGFGEYTPQIQACEQYFQEWLRSDVSPGSKAFLKHKARNGHLWADYLKSSEVRLDANGFVNGAWGEAITSACIFEAENPAWNNLGPYSEDGPAGQIHNYLAECGYGEHAEALQKTEDTTHQAIANGKKLPVFDATFYQATVGTEPAAVVDEPPPPPSGRKKAVLVGCNYPGTKAQLNGCVNDVGRWKGVLTSIYGFDEKDMIILRDQGEENWKKTSIRANWLNAIRWLVDGAAPGDVLFFQFSGHGGQRACTDGSEADGYDELVIPSDYQSKGVLVDQELFDLMVAPLPSGVKLTVILDCCHSGSALDLPFTWNEAQKQWDVEKDPWHTAGDVQMFSGCEDEQCSMDAYFKGKAAGAMTTCLCDVIESHYKKQDTVQYPALLMELRDVLTKRNFEQRPKLSSSQPFGIGEKMFTLAEGHVPNMNKTLGRKGGKAKPPRQNAAGFKW